MNDDSQFEARANGNAVGDLWHLMSKTDQTYVTKAILRAQRKVLADKLKQVKAKDAE